MMMKRELHTFIIGSVLFFTACGDKQESEQKSGYRIQGDTDTLIFSSKRGSAI